MPEKNDTMPEWRRLLRENAQDGVPPSDAPEFLFSGAEVLRDLALAREIFERSFRRGVTLCAAGETGLTVLLLWRGNIFGVYRHTLAARGVDGVLQDLKEFRLGWLPEETVRQTGGEGSAFADLPPEAEGFPAVFFAGVNAGLFAGHGKIYEKQA
ncbi:hypothetical protein KL86DPRO_60102 [uncultured delta proteobacterium]|uniref:Uncharacterized protein n=1 Tax=uncultured delta proteobacterium TaxID=34034 RepID=A0A212KF60_9DELT|nr:hypothetical protein KL86DPRO_60102 [uncultured delta proteobacterium]